MWINSKLAMNLQTNNQLREAMHSSIPPKIHNLIITHLLNNTAILSHPPRMILQHHQHHFPFKPLRSYIQRDQPIIELMVHVPCVTSGGKHHTGHGIHDVTSCVRAIAWRWPKSELIDGVHNSGFPFPCVWSNDFSTY